MISVSGAERGNLEKAGILSGPQCSEVVRTLVWLTRQLELAGNTVYGPVQKIDGGGMKREPSEFEPSPKDMQQSRR